MLKDAKWIIEETSLDLMHDLEQENYCSICMNYADVQQRWVVYFSPQAYARAVLSVNRQFLKQSYAELKQFTQLCQQEFSCPKDAEPDYFIWQIEGSVASIIEERELKLRKKSCFILATNQLDIDQLSEEELIRRYKKDQQKVERGFRFLKDPQFLAATLYLKKPERIMALLMIMTLSLLIYATLEYQIRTALEENDELFPNQKGKPIRNPTTRWIFQSFSGIHVLSINQTQVLILNLKEKHQLILKLLGKRFQKIYSEN